MARGLAERLLGVLRVGGRDARARIDNLRVGQRRQTTKVLASKSPAMQRTFLIYAVITALVLAGLAKVVFGLTSSMAIAVFFLAAIIAFVTVPF